MAKTKKARDDIRTPLEEMLKSYGQSAGIDLRCAIRDLLTELMHLCDDHGMDFSQRLRLARRVCSQERFGRSADPLKEGEDDNEANKASS